MNKDSMGGEAVSYYRRYGFSIVPVAPTPEKKATVKWTKYQTERATEEEILAWWAKDPDSMIGMITGELSGVDVVDVDGTETPQELIDILGEDLERIPGSRTPRGGRHYYFKHREGVRGKTNIWKAEKGKTMVDIRGEGNYAILPPSSN